VSEDPIGFAAGDANVRRYVGNGVTRNIDLLGLDDGFGFGSFLLLTDGLGFIQRDAEVKAKEAETVWNNSRASGHSLIKSIYITGGTAIASEVGVRGIDDAFHLHDAVDAHVQSPFERLLDGGTGTIQLGGTAIGLKSMIIRNPAAASGGLFRRPVGASSVEPAPQELLEAMARKGRTIKIAQEGSEEMRYLDFIGAEANVGGEDLTHMLLRPNPGKAAALEEFLHGTQWRIGLVKELETVSKPGLA
jgi:hypothetical protein